MEDQYKCGSYNTDGGIKPLSERMEYWEKNEKIIVEPHYDSGLNYRGRK